MIYILLFVNFCLLSLCVIIFNKDICAAPCLMFLSSCLCNVATLYMAHVYEVQFGFQILIITLLGSVSVFGGAIIAREKTKVSILCDDYNLIFIPKIKFFFLMIFSLIVFMITYQAIRDTLDRVGISYINLSDMIGKYRTFYLLKDELLPFPVRVSIRMLKMLAYIMLYIFVNNITIEKSIKNLKSLFVVIIYIFVIMLQGSRTALIYTMLAFVTLYVLLYQKRKGLLIKRLTTLIKIMLFAVIVLLFFSYIRGFVGRTHTWSLIEYVTYYFGIPMCAFQINLELFPNPKYNFGMLETFTSLLSSLSRYISSINVPEIGFTFYKGKSLGNIYTAFRKFYYDFGLLGVSLFSMVESLLFTRMYIKLCSMKKMNILVCIMYIYLIPEFYLMYYDDHFFSVSLSPGILIDILSLLMWFVMIFKIKVIVKR